MKNGNGKPVDIGQSEKVKKKMRRSVRLETMNRTVRETTLANERKVSLRRKNDSKTPASNYFKIICRPQLILNDLNA